MAAPLLCLLIGFAAAAPGSAPAPIAYDAGVAWSERAAGFAATRVVAREPVERAIAGWEAAIAARPGDLEARFRLIEALYFLGHFAAQNPAEARRAADRELALAEETFALAVASVGGASGFERLSVAEEAELERGLPDARAAHFWCAISWGVWGMAHGNLASARRGVASRIRRHAELLIALDEDYADAGGLRLLGRLHTLTPKVPLVTGWIDRRRGIELLRRACAISTRDARNPLFLAEALLEHAPERHDEAVALLREVASREADARYLVEETETLESARALLARTARP